MDIGKMWNDGWNWTCEHSKALWTDAGKIALGVTAIVIGGVVVAAAANSDEDDSDDESLTVEIED